MDSIISALTTSSFAWPLQFCLFSTVVTYIASVLTSNVSQVDRVWTFLPLIYTAYFALLPLWPLEQTIPLLPFVPSDLQSESQDIFWSPRALILLFLVTIWMFRLSYNTYRRGLFSLSDEDYRWAVLRAQLPPFLFQLVNLTFIAATQNLLLLTLGYPAYLASMQKPQMLYSDAFLELWALGVLLIEFTADNQQFVYQTYKHAYLDHFRKAASSSAAHTHALEVASKAAWPFASPSPAQSISTANASDSGRTLLTNLRLTPTEAHRGFITSGFWAYSRHPNFACEQTFWWIICFIPFSARAYPLVMFGDGAVTSFLEMIMSALENIKSTFTFTHFPNPTSLTSLTPFLPLLPALLLSILFFSSTLYTEAISKSKYPLPTPLTKLESRCLPF
ncbi:hypothetical protein BT96DRAFT_66834 [Gymnopus androsaceus JB14]|uniref:DUF1295-domain-containing protein n=1 Tax=Gymnopus androsaceus JB14 TaxID=1447944 RepID=A0A6A4HIZ4_9AGAR|nr:hypothetical protein BT96DRAFT_66834 [Gymnopus androsaceus JB14]